MVPSQKITYLGMSLDTRENLARPSDKRVLKWLSIAKSFLAQQVPPAGLWLQILGHLVSLEKLVPLGRSRIHPLQWQLRQHWSQLTDSPALPVPLNQESKSSILWWMTLDNLYKGVPLGTVVIDEYLFTDSSILGLGCSYGKPTGIRPVVPSTKTLPHQPSGSTCCVVGASSLLQLPGTNQCCHHVGQHVHSCLLEKSGGHSVTTDVRPGTTGVLMGRSSSDHFDPQTYSGTLECQSRLSEPQGSDNQNRMESKSGRGRQDFPPLGQSTCGLICSNGEYKTGYLHVPNSGDSSLESGQPSAVLGRSLSLCIPPNSPNQIMSKQDQIGQSRGHPDCAILAEPGVVSRPRGLVNRFSNNPSPNEDSPQTVILPPVSSTTSIAEPSHMAIISGYIEQRGFSKPRNIKHLTMKTAFLLSLATAKRNSELHFLP